MRQLEEEFKVAGDELTESETSTQQGKRRSKGRRGRKRRKRSNEEGKDTGL